MNKRINILGAIKILIAFLVLGSLFTSCADDIIINNVDEADYNNVVDIYGSLRDATSMKTTNVIDALDDVYNTEICFNLPRVPKAGVDVEVLYDESYVKKYNKEHNTSFIALPRDLYSIQNGGKITVAPNQKMSYTLDLTIKLPEAVASSQTYLLPLMAKAQSDNPQVLSENARLNYIIKTMPIEEGSTPGVNLKNTAFKGEDAVKNFLFFEVNDTNPLNALLFRLEDGAYLFDYVVLFAANINYNAELGEVYVSCNPNVQFLLDHNEEFLQPLRKHGIKVILGLLGNHDASGLAQLSEIGAKQFASKVAALCDAYDLDGVNFDDEYSGAPDVRNPLFTYVSRFAAGRLMYETKKLMPDKAVTVFDWGAMYGCEEVNGVPAGEWIDIVVANYGSAAHPLKGMTLKNCSGMSTEFQRYGSIGVNQARSVKQNGYGYAMQFALWAYGNAFNTNQITSLNNLSIGLYDMPLMPVNHFYYKNSPKPTKMR